MLKFVLIIWQRELMNMLQALPRFDSKWAKTHLRVSTEVYVPYCNVACRRTRADVLL